MLSVRENNVDEAFFRRKWTLTLSEKIYIDFAEDIIGLHYKIVRLVYLKTRKQRQGNYVWNILEAFRIWTYFTYCKAQQKKLSNLSLLSSLASFFEFCCTKTFTKSSKNIKIGWPRHLLLRLSIFQEKGSDSNQAMF